MAIQQLFYESAVPVSPQRHGNWSLEVANDYKFTQRVNSVPLMAVEFPHAASEYAIVFSGTKETVIPAVILGMRSDQNLYLAEDGGWQAKYVPAFVRRYPFVFASSSDGKTFTLCVDESFPRLNQDGRGERLFNDAQKPTPLVERALKFLEQYQIESRRTQTFCKQLVELDLLEPMRAQANFGGGEKLSLVGFMAVNRDKVKALPGEKLADLAKSDALELLYLHLASMRNFAAMAERAGAAASRASEGAVEKDEPRTEETHA